MKKYLVLSVFILTASVIFYSCDDLIYSPKEEHFVNVDVPHTTMSINLDNAKDTVNLSGAVDLRYTVDTRGKRFSKIAIYIDSMLVATTDDQKHYFYIATGSYSDGPHKLFLQLWAFSGTGSLADKIGAEFIVSTSLWNVYIDNRQWTGPISMYNATAKNGTLELSWQKYTYHNFVNYEIYRAQLDGSGTPGMYYKIATITDPEKTWCTDNDYVGGPGVSYKVVVNATNRSITSNSISYYDSAVQICSVTPLDEQTFEIKWRKQKYYANFTKYTLSRQDDDGYRQDVDIVSKTDVSDTSYIDKGGFGKVFYYIKCYGHNNYSTVSGGDPGQAGKSLDLKSINAVQYVPENNSFYFNKSIRLDGASLKVMAQGTGDIWVSRSGKLAVSNGATAAAEYHYPPHSFTMVDPLTLQPVSQTRNTDELLGYYSVNEGLVISETGCCLYGGSKLVNNSRSGVIAGILVRLNPYGLIPQDPVVNIGSDGSGSISRQTDEGEYILYSGTLGLPGYDFMYNLTDGKLKRLYTASGEFLPSGKEYISTSYGSASVCRCKDNVFVRSFSTASATRSFSVDPVTGYLAIMTTDSRLMIYDPSNGKLMKDIRLPDGNIQHFLANSVLFSGKGYYYKLSFN